MPEGWLQTQIDKNPLLLVLALDWLSQWPLFHLYHSSLTQALLEYHLTASSHMLDSFLKKC
jgi:hypothetical protein